MPFVHLPKSLRIILYNGCAVWKFLYLPLFSEKYCRRIKILVLRGRVAFVQGRGDVSLLASGVEESCFDEFSFSITLGPRSFFDVMVRCFNICSY
jgi:hypothetical protein